MTATDLVSPDAVDQSTVAKFRELQILIAKKAEAQADLKAKDEAKAAKARNLLVRISQAEIEIVGFCPSLEMHRELRRLRKERTRVCAEIDKAKLAIPTLVDELGRSAKRVEATTGDELDREQRNHRRLELEIAGLREDLAVFEVTRNDLTAKKEAHCELMRAFEV